MWIERKLLYLIASRIPLGPGGSIALNNASGVPLGGLRGCLGGLRRASWGLLGASWAPRRPRSPQEFTRTRPNLPQNDPKRPQMAAKGLPKEAPEAPKRPQEAIKALQN